MASHPAEHRESGSPIGRSAAEAAPAALSLRGVTKRFPHVLANDNVDLDVYRGEVHAILGENGAGKSTLMKILYGYYQPDSGTISHRGVPIRIHSPREGRQHGIGMVFQDFTLVPALTVTENIALVVPDLPLILPMQALEEEIRALSERYHFRIDPRAPIYDLSIGEQQKVEILKLLLAKAEFLIFDEPTSVLAPHEIHELLEVFRRLRQDGLAVLFITHKLREVLAVADRITVLRRGKVAATLPPAEATEAGLVALMLGSTSQAEAVASASSPAPQDALPRSPKAWDEGDTLVLEIRNADVPDPAGRVHLHSVSLSISPGEIVGVAAVAGNGQRELGELVLGLRHCHSGSVRLLGIWSQHWSPMRTVDLGIACVPEDPLREGAVPSMTVLENMVLPIRKQFAGRWGLAVRWSLARDYVVRALQSFGLHMPALEAPIGTLSGGNIQRVVFTREVARQPKLLLSYYPTRGMDVPSAHAARELLRTLRAAGTAILLVSEDLDELLALSDRLVVMHRGRIVGTFRSDDEPSPHSIGLLMTGGEQAMAEAEANKKNGWQLEVLLLPVARSPRVREGLYFVGALVLALSGFALVLLLQGRDPIETYTDMLGITLGSAYGRSEVLVKMIPLLLCALAVAVPARVGLVNVGGEGQLYMGAWLASWAALSLPGLPPLLLLPLMLLLSMIGGGLWALLPAFLRARGWLNETISTLLLNYVAILIVQYFVFGPWKDPGSGNFPQSAAFVPAAQLPVLPGSRLHAGIVIGLLVAIILYFILHHTRWGYEMRAIGGNGEAAQRVGIPVALYIVSVLVIGAALAGIAGFGEVSAIQGRLRPDLSPGYGYIGFLVSWLAAHNPLTIVLMSLLIAVIITGGDSLQMNQHLPFASVNLLMALTLFVVLALRGRSEAKR